NNPTDSRQNFVNEVQHGVLIGMPVHGSGEHQGIGLHGDVGARLEVVDIDARGNSVNALYHFLIMAVCDKSTPVILGNRQCHSGAATCLDLAASHLAPLQCQQQLPYGIGVVATKTSPNHVLDVMGE